MNLKKHQLLISEEKYGIKNKFMGLCVANFYKSKGHVRIVESMKKLKRSDITIVFIGKDGEGIKYLERMRKIEYCYSQNINREDIISAYHQADIFCLLLISKLFLW